MNCPCNCQRDLWAAAYPTDSRRRDTSSWNHSVVTHITNPWQDKPGFLGGKPLVSIYALWNRARVPFPCEKPRWQMPVSGSIAVPLLVCNRSAIFCGTTNSTRVCESMRACVRGGAVHVHTRRTSIKGFTYQTHKHKGIHSEAAGSIRNRLAV